MGGGGVSRRVLAGVLLAWAAASPPAAAQTTVEVRIETSLGTIWAEVDTVMAPVTANNFLRYVDLGLYNGGSFYRTVRMDNQPDNEVKIEVIQGGIDRSRREELSEPIPMEPTSVTGILHLDGTLSMARGGPDTARAEFFICIGAQPELDQGGRRNSDGWGFAAFGRVRVGMEVVRLIQAQEAEGQYFPEGKRVTIEGIYRAS